MKLVSFNLFRTLGLPNTQYLKPEQYQKTPAVFAHILSSADFVLFPEFWQLNGLLYGLGSRIFPSEASYRIGHDKIEMTRVCKLIVPEHIPQTCITTNTESEAERLWSEFYTPFVAKDPKSCQGKGVWLIKDHKDWQEYLQKTDILYVQEYLPIEKDLRIVVAGNKIITAYWRHQSDRSFHTNVSRGGQISFGAIPETAMALTLYIAKKLNINHAGFDIAVVDNHPYFLEFNRLFGNQGIPGGGKAITDAIYQYLLAQNPDDKPSSPDKGQKLANAS